MEKLTDQEIIKRVIQPKTKAEWEHRKPIKIHIGYIEHAIELARKDTANRIFESLENGHILEGYFTKPFNRLKKKWVGYKQPPIHSPSLKAGGSLGANY
ncbi:MAG TPA: hypothetical protein VL945_00185 [Candidatus Saccharimonadales bacterium]|nr:hypothetical protein [Candidatus Saccharimonadales bacterium]